MGLFENLGKMVNEDEQLKELQVRYENEIDPVKRESLGWELQSRTVAKHRKAQKNDEFNRDISIIEEMRKTGMSYDEVAKYADTGLLKKQQSMRINSDLETSIMKGASIENALVDVLKTNGINLDAEMLHKAFENKKKKDNEDFMKVVREG